MLCFNSECDMYRRRPFALEDSLEHCLMFSLPSITNLTNSFQDYQISAACCCIKKKKVNWSDIMSLKHV